MKKFLSLIVLFSGSLLCARYKSPLNKLSAEQLVEMQKKLILYSREHPEVVHNLYNPNSYARELPELVCNRCFEISQNSDSEEELYRFCKRNNDLINHLQLARHFLRDEDGHMFYWLNAQRLERFFTRHEEHPEWKEGRSKEDKERSKTLIKNLKNALNVYLNLILIPRGQALSELKAKGLLLKSGLSESEKELDEENEKNLKHVSELLTIIKSHS